MNIPHQSQRKFLMAFHKGEGQFLLDHESSLLIIFDLLTRSEGKYLMGSLKTRSTDAKGCISLPKGFANLTVIIEQVNENELRIRKARVIPEDDLRFAEETPVALSDRDRQSFLQALDHPPAHNAALRSLMAGDE